MNVHNSALATTDGVKVQGRPPEGLEFVTTQATSTDDCTTCGYNNSLGVGIADHLPKDSTAMLLLTARVTGTGEIINLAEVLVRAYPT